jgi:hypothetical protein
MRDPGPILLQVCPNDTAPFADICRYYEAAARSLSWKPLTVMLDARAPTPEPDFHYLRSPFTDVVRRMLGGRQPVLTLCHRYRAYRVTASSGLAAAPLVTVAHEFGLLERRQRRLRRHLDRQNYAEHDESAPAKLHAGEINGKKGLAGRERKHDK